MNKWHLKYKPFSVNLENLLILSPIKSTILSQGNILIMMLIFNKLENYLLLKNKRINTITLLIRKYRNFGWRFLQIVIFWVSRLKKEMSPFWNIYWRFKLVNLKILRKYGLTSTFLKTSGLPILSYTKNFSLMDKLLKRVRETKLIGKKIRILLSQL